MLCLRVLRLVVLVGILSLIQPLRATEVLVFAAASLTDSLRHVAGDYGKTNSDRIVFNFSASSTLARQIEEGAPADIFFSADEAQMQRLISKGLINTGSCTNLVSNSLVIVVAAGNGAAIHGPGDLATASVIRIALGDPKAVPIGVYARRFLEQADLWQAVAPKVVPTENVRAALAAVESGNADASIVYKTDALISKRVVVACTLPADKVPEIHYPVTLLKTSESKAAISFFEYLKSHPALDTFERYGFLIQSH